MQTWTYGRYTVKIEKSRVAESNCESFPVGSRVARGQMAACGWRKPKKTAQYDVWGQKIS